MRMCVCKSISQYNSSAIIRMGVSVSNQFRPKIRDSIVKCQMGRMGCEKKLKKVKKKR